jgi:YfiH family protein
MIRRGKNGLGFYQFEPLVQQHEILHAVFTRIGGTSQAPFASLNVGQLVGDDPQAVQANHERILASLGIQAGHVVTAQQVHGARVAVVDAGHHGTVVPSTDALVSNCHGVYLLMRFADCLPLMLYDPVQRAVALVHGGWRGVLAGVVRNTVQTLRSTFGSQPKHIIAALGPAIRSCCYQVGPDVVERVRHAFEHGDELLPLQLDGSVHFDLPGAVRAQLRDLGLRNIQDSHLCTACHTDEFYSHRAEAARTGRFAALIGLRETAGNPQTH